MRRRRRRQLRGPAYIMADALMALAIVLTLLTLLSVAVARQRRGGERLADSRAAIRLAEATITALQTGASLPAAPDGMTVQVRSIPTPAEFATPSGSTWVDVEVSYGKARGTNLSGLVRADAANAAAAKGAIK